MTVASPREPASAISWHERGGANRPPLEQFAAYLAATKLVVDRELEARLRVAAASADHVGMPAGSVVEAIRALTLRGGKRFRPALLALAYEACGGEGCDRTALLLACSASNYQSLPWRVASVSSDH